MIRLKSPHDEVHLVTMLPSEGDLEALLSLESILRCKIRAASVYGMESGVLDDVETELRNYAHGLPTVTTRCSMRRATPPERPGSPARPCAPC